MIIIEGGTVLTVDDAGHVYSPGHVVLEDDRITAAGPGRYQGQDGVADTRSAEKIDAAGMVVLPGLVDLHYHTAIELLTMDEDRILREANAGLLRVLDRMGRPAG